MIYKKKQQWNPNHNSNKLFVKTENPIQKFIWKCKWHGIAKVTLKRRIKFNDKYCLTLTYYEVTWQYDIDITIDKIVNRTRESRSRPSLYGYLNFFYKGIKEIHEEIKVFTSDARYSHTVNKLWSLPTSYAKIWDVVCLNVEGKIWTLLRKLDYHMKVGNVSSTIHRKQ